MPRSKRPEPDRRRSSRALGATVALSGLLLYQSGYLDASTGLQEDQGLPGPGVPVAAPEPEVEAPAPPGDSPSQDDNAASPGAKAEIEADPPGAAPDDPRVSPAGGKLDEAEVIARLERIIRANREELEKQKAQLDDGPDSDYRKAEQELSELDTRLEEAEEALRAALDAGQDDEAAALEERRDELARRRQLAADRFELEIRERKAANEQVDILEKTIAADEKQLRTMLGEAPPPAAAEGPETAPPGPDDPAPEPTSPTPSAPPGSPAAAPEPAVPPAPATLPGLAAPAPAPEPEAGAPVASETPEVEDEEVARARQEVDARAAAAERADRRSQSLDERLQLIDRNIATIRDQLANAQRKADIARQTRDLLAQQFRDRSLDDAPQAELRPLRDQIATAEDAVREATAEVRDRTTRLEQLRDERDLILEAREAVFLEAASTRAELEAARAALEQASNPFSTRNLSKWAVERGPGILVILVGAGVLIWLINRLDRRLVKWIADRSARGSQAERENRAETLVSVFQNAASLVIVIGAGIMSLDQAGIPIAPILGGAAVLGLAISFGAQNLVSDFFYGFMILLENQYKLNDVVKINDHSGAVERITLRMTALRDLEGNLHFIPNGQVTAVINMTHGWSRALFDIGVAYKEDADRVMDVIMELGKELRADPRFRPLILEDPTMLGVDGFADSAVIIKFFIKTRPLQQWAVKRELLRRIKRRFDELGIEIPFPHRTVYHRSDAEGFRHITVEADRGLDGEGGGIDHGNGFPR